MGHFLKRETSRIPCFDETSCCYLLLPNLWHLCVGCLSLQTGVLKKNNTLVDLSLDLNAIGDRGAWKLVETSWNLIHFCFLEEYSKLLPIYTRFTIGIYRESNYHQDFILMFSPRVLTSTLAGAEAFGEAVSSNHALQRLDLSNNGIKGAGAQTQTRRSMEHMHDSCSKL